MQNVKPPSNKTFGYFFTILFILVGIYLIYFNNKIFGNILLGVALLLLIVTILKPVILNKLNYIWHQIGLMLGRVISPIIIGIIFFMLITPIAICMRIINRDYLRLKKNNNESYWLDKKSKSDSIEYFKNQY